MSVRIRLRRVGRKKQPYYRVVVMNSTASRDSAYIDEVGFYNPRTQPASLRMDLEKVDQWLAQGAELTDSAASLIRKARNGGDRTVRLVQPGEEAAKTASVPERRPASRSVAEPAQESSSGGAAEPSEETIAKAEPIGDDKAEPEVVVETGVEATPANEEKAEPAEVAAVGGATEEAVEAAAKDAGAAEAEAKPKKKGKKKGEAEATEA